MPRSSNDEHLVAVALTQLDAGLLLDLRRALELDDRLFAVDRLEIDLAGGHCAGRAQRARCVERLAPHRLLAHGGRRRPRGDAVDADLEVTEWDWKELVIDSPPLSTGRSPGSVFRILDRPGDAARERPDEPGVDRDALASAAISIVAFRTPAGAA